MAKEKQQAGNGNGSSLTLADANASAVGLAVLGSGPTDDLAGIEGFAELDIQDDGLTEFTPDDIKLPVWIWNANITDAEGNPIPKNVFFNTLTEEVRRELDVVLIKVHMTNQWAEFNEETKHNEIRCSSFDRVDGTMSDGTARKCEGCPDYKWQMLTDNKGKLKRGRKCGPTWLTYAVELATLQPCVIKFKRTGLKPAEDYVSRHHLGQRKLRDKTTGKIRLVNYPLYTYACRLTLKMADSKTYAYPVIERGAVLPAQMMQLGSDTAQYVNDVLLRNLSKIIEADGHVAEVVNDEGDTSFDTSKMGGGEGQDFTDSPKA